MFTQLEDISNKVSQEKISNSRLRNEEIRRNMSKPWESPTEAVESTYGRQPYPIAQINNTGTQPNTDNYSRISAVGSGSPIGNTGTTQSIVPNKMQGNNLSSLPKTTVPHSTVPSSTISTTGGNPLATVRGTSPALSSTYSGMKNSWNTNSPQTNTNDLSSTGWLPTAVGQTASAMGAGPYSGLASAAMSAAQGNKSGAVGSLSSTLARVAGAGNFSGLFGTLASGIMGDKDASEIGMNMANSGLGTVLSMANPIAGAAYNVARMMGLNPAQGLASMFDTKNYTEEGGHKGGFFTKPSEYTGYTPGQAYEPGLNNLFSQNSGSFTGGDNPNGTPGYSNPAASYGGWSASPSSSDTGGE